MRTFEEVETCFCSSSDGTCTLNCINREEAHTYFDIGPDVTPSG